MTETDFMNIQDESSDNLQKIIAENMDNGIIKEIIEEISNRKKADRFREIKRIGFIGLGLIGGTIARAVREFHPNTEITAFDPDKQALAEAVNDGVVDHAAFSIDESFSVCDIIYLCAPVALNDENLKLLIPYLRPDAILTDVGSVKTDIHMHIQNAGLSQQFIGGHPMTGSERIGYRNSKASFLENAYYILTPEPDFPQAKSELMQEFVRSLGAIPLKLSYREHDFVTGAISHLPHVISASLVNLVKESDNSEGIMKMIAAGGFKDITRISSSSPQMWEQICLTNTDNILLLLDRYMDKLSSIRSEISQKSGSNIYNFFNDARSYRDSFSETHSGPIRKEYSIRIEIADRPGVLAEVVTILAINQINIKNIGIVHNREYAEGVLRVELPDERSLKSAEKILSDRGYRIFK